MHFGQSDWAGESPELKGFNFKGGLHLRLSLIALWFALAIYTGAFIAENVRAGIQAISHGQTEAAAALGMRPGRIMSLIILPQALRVTGYMAFVKTERLIGFATGLLSGVVAVALVLYLGSFVTAALSGFIALEPVASRDMGGFMLNLILGTVCVSLSIPLGIVLALGRQSNMPIIKGICVVFIEFIRGVPLITLLFVANVVLSYFFPPGTNLDLILRVIIMITLFSAAYIAEVIRGGLAALPRGQYEAADSLGLDYPQAMRLIILPQALKISIPGIVNVAVGLFKDTTLVSVISMFDLVGMIRGPISSSTAWTGIYWELYLFAILLFFVVCYGISQYSQWLERQLRTDHH